MAPEKDFDKMEYLKSTAKTVKSGQRFGFKALFRSTQEKVKLRVELHVPRSAEKFPSHSGKTAVSADGKSVTVTDEIDGRKGSIAYYWGVAKDDPKGRYELKFSLEDVPVETYTFTVE